MLSHFNAKVQCDAVVIRELCESRDSCCDLLFSRKELEVFIEMLYIKNILCIKHMNKFLTSIDIVTLVYILYC